MVGFRDFDGVGIAPVSNKLAVKGYNLGSKYLIVMFFKYYFIILQ